MFRNIYTLHIPAIFPLSRTLALSDSPAESVVRVDDDDVDDDGTCDATRYRPDREIIGNFLGSRASRWEYQTLAEITD